MDPVDRGNMFKYFLLKTLNFTGIPAVVLLTTFCLCGCGEPVPPPPTEKAELVTRFFASINSKDVNSAMRQGIKLRSLDKHNENIIRLVEIQQCNAYVEAAQKKLNSGDVNGAIAVLRKGVQRYPENVSLRETLPRIRQLRNASKLIRGMKTAATSIAMRSALTAAKIGLSLNMTPALQKYFDQYEKKIAAAEVKEKAEAEAREKAEQAKAAEEKNELKKAAKEKAAAKQNIPEKSSVENKVPEEPKLSPIDKK